MSLKGPSISPNLGMKLDWKVVHTTKFKNQKPLRLINENERNHSIEITFFQLNSEWAA